jgi:hypothetical protein
VVLSVFPTKLEWLETFSLPAKSTKLRTDSFMMLAPSFVVVTDSTCNLNNVCEREL